MRTRLTVFVLLLAHTVSAVGIPLHFHYCKGDLKHVTVFAKRSCHDSEKSARHADSPFACCLAKSSSCAPVGTIAQKDCCSDGVEYLQSDELAPVPNLATVSDDVPLGLFAGVAPYDLANFDLHRIDDRANAPPPLNVLNLYLDHCCLLFYG